MIDPIKTLTAAEIVAKAMQQKAVLGWRINAVAIERNAIGCRVRIDWRDPTNKMRRVTHDDDQTSLAGDHVISIDLDRLPDGVTPLGWTQTPGESHVCQMPTDADAREVSRLIDGLDIAKFEHADGTTSWLTKSRYVGGTPCR